MIAPRPSSNPGYMPLEFVVSIYACIVDIQYVGPIVFRDHGKRMEFMGFGSTWGHNSYTGTQNGSKLEI